MSRRARRRPNKRAPWQYQDDDTTGAVIHMEAK